jgi:hypothetical protein
MICPRLRLFQDRIAAQGLKLFWRVGRRQDMRIGLSE